MLRGLLYFPLLTLPSHLYAFNLFPRPDDGGESSLGIQADVSTSQEESLLDDDKLAILGIPGLLSSILSPLTGSLVPLTTIPAPPVAVQSLTAQAPGTGGASDPLGILSILNQPSVIPSVVPSLPVPTATIPGVLSTLGPVPPPPAATPAQPGLGTAGDGGGLGGLVSVIPSLLSPLFPAAGGSNLPLLSPILPLGGLTSALQVPEPTALIQNVESVASEILGLSSVPRNDVPGVIATLAAIVPALGNGLTSALPALTSVVAELLGGDPSVVSEVAPLVNAITTQIGEIGSQVLTGVAQVPSNAPILSLAIPTPASLGGVLPTVAITFAPEAATLLSDLAPITSGGDAVSEFASQVAALAGSENPDLIESLTSALMETLTHLMSASAISSLLNQATPVALLSPTQVVINACSAVSFVGGLFITVPTPCGATPTAASLTSSVGSVGGSISSAVSPVSSPSAASASPTEALSTQTSGSSLGESVGTSAGTPPVTVSTGGSATMPSGSSLSSSAASQGQISTTAASGSQVASLPGISSGWFPGESVGSSRQSSPAVVSASASGQSSPVETSLWPASSGPNSATRTTLPIPIASPTEASVPGPGSQAGTSGGITSSSHSVSAAALSTAPGAGTAAIPSQSNLPSSLPITPGSPQLSTPSGVGNGPSSTQQPLPNSATSTATCGCEDSSGGNFGGPSSTIAPNGGTGNLGPCPGLGYTCDDCLDGWFCPPQQTPAVPAPCGFGWPCDHCHGGWFCVPSLVPATVTLCPIESVGSPTGPQSQGGPQTITSTTFVTVPPGGSQPASFPSPTLHPPIAGWAYAGCYKDDSARALKNESITTANPSGMNNEMCITFCKNQGYKLAGTEHGFQCFCGDWLVDSWLIGESSCNAACSSDDSYPCGGNWALNVWSPDGKVSLVAGPELQYTLPLPPPGQSDIAVHPGGLRQSVVQITTGIFMFPKVAAVAPTTLLTVTTLSSTPCRDFDTNSMKVAAVDVEDLVSTTLACATAAMKEAYRIAANELGRPNPIAEGTGNPSDQEPVDMSDIRVHGDNGDEMICITTCPSDIPSFWGGRDWAYNFGDAYSSQLRI